VTKEIIQKIVQKELGGSTLAARKIWYDGIVGRLNDEGRGKFLGSFKGDDRILTLYRNGEYRLSSFDLATHFDEDMVHIEKWIQDRPISTVYFDAEKEMHYVKRFVCEVQVDKRISFISEAAGSYMDVVSTAYRPVAKIVYNKLLKETKNLPDNVMNLADLIEVKGMKAQGNQMTKLKVKEIILTHPIDESPEPWPDVKVLAEETAELNILEEEDEAGPTPTMEWDLSKKEEEDNEDQIKLF
jgi:topoisomerase-4 subunit A